MNQENKELVGILSRENEIRFNKTTAGAGFFGLFAIGLSIIAAYYLNEIQLYGTMMTIVAIGFLTFNVDFQFKQFAQACLNVIFRSRHITDLSNELIECNEILDEVEKNYIDEYTADTIDENLFKNNAMALFIKNKRNMNSETIINTFENRVYNDTDETYAICISILENVGNLMPLAGLVGTVFGIIVTLSNMSESSSVAQITSNISVAMQTTLYGALYSILFKVVASRFKQKRDALEYDFERLKNHIELLHSK
jgi:flagellar motor component MotA